jgi:hypothetical protein
MVEWSPARLRHPRFHRVADLIARFADAHDWPSIAALNAAFGVELGRVGVRLVEAPKSKFTLGPDGTIDVSSLYEVRIVERGEIPTRPSNVHDLLNALIWAAFPETKLALTRALATIQRQRAAGCSTLPNARTPEHDRLAMFDEGAIVRVEGAGTWIFGHAMYEHAYAGELDVRGAAVDLVVPGVVTREAIDRALATRDLAQAVRRGAGVLVED